MRIVLIGHSHLARVRRDLTEIGPDVLNAAEGGACSPDLRDQVDRAGVLQDDVVVVSIGTNDAGRSNPVPLEQFVDSVVACMGAIAVAGWVYVAPPGVDEARLPGVGDRTNAVIDAYRDAAIAACSDVAATVVRADEVVAPLGRRAFVEDGLHLSGRAYGLLLPAIAAAVRATS